LDARPVKVKQCTCLRYQLNKPVD